MEALNKKLSLGNKNHSYYGKMDSIEVEDNVSYMMLDIHIQRLVDKQGERFIKELDNILKEFKISLIEKFKSINLKQSTSNAYMKVEIKALQKRMDAQEKREKKAREAESLLANKGIDRLIE